MITWDSQEREIEKFPEVSHRAWYQKAKIKFGVVLKDKMRIHVSLMTMESSGRCNVLMATVSVMLSSSAIITTISGSDWKLETKENQR